MSRASGARAAAVVLLAAGTLLAFWPVLDCGFLTYDDDLYVTGNPRVQSGLGLGNLAWAWTTFHAANWHPLTWISHMLDWQLSGSSPMGHHLASLLLHAASALLLFAALDVMTGSPGRSAFVAGLFALHPLRVESVAWVAERKDVLSGLFFMLALYFYARHARAPGRRSMVAVALAFGLGLAAKPVLVTLPFVLLLLDYWPLGRWKKVPGGSFSLPWPLVREKIPLLLLSAASSILTLLAQSRGLAVATLREYSPWVRVENALVSYVAYLGKAAWPAHLAVFYPHPGAALPAWRVAGAAVLLALVTAATFRLRHRLPHLVVGWVWYVGMLVPMIGVVQVGMQAMADRYTYLPLIGVSVIVAWSVREAWMKWMVVPAALVLVMLVTLTRAQIESWRDTVELFEHALETAEGCPGSETIHYQLATALVARGDAAGAVRHYEAALAGDPQYAEAHAGLGAALAELGRNAQAREHYVAALRLYPDFPTAHSNLANLLAVESRTAEALEHYAAALRLDPDYVDARNNRGFVLAALGRLDEAAADFTSTLSVAPDSAQAHYGLGTVRAAEHRWREAADHFSEAIRLRPDHGKAHSGLATALSFLGDSRDEPSTGR